MNRFTMSCSLIGRAMDMYFVESSLHVKCISEVWLRAINTCVHSAGMTLVARSIRSDLQTSPLQETPQQAKARSLTALCTRTSTR